MSHPECVKPEKVSVEDLFRLKRSERPSPEFWGRFEQELRAKQLAAIIEKRPWWISLRLPQAARYLARLQVPVGAAAVLVLCFVVVREYRPSLDSGGPLGEAHSISHYTEVSPDVHGIPYSTNVVGSSAAVGEASGLADSSAAPAISETVAAYEPALVGNGGLMAMIPWAPQLSTSVQSENPVVLGELTPVHFSAPVNPGRDHDFQGKMEVQPAVMPVRPAVVAEVEAALPASSRDVRRNRILSNLVLADSIVDAEHSRRAGARSDRGTLDDDRLYDNVRRLGMGGDRLTLKF